jgi:hypothetical protein
MPETLNLEWLSGWWFQTFFIFPYIGNHYPKWPIFFRGVGITPTSIYISIYWYFSQPWISWFPPSHGCHFSLEVMPFHKMWNAFSAVSDVYDCVARYGWSSGEDDFNMALYISVHKKMTRKMTFKFECACVEILYIYTYLFLYIFIVINACNMSPGFCVTPKNILAYLGGGQSWSWDFDFLGWTKPHLWDV